MGVSSPCILFRQEFDYMSREKETFLHFSCISFRQEIDFCTCLAFLARKFRMGMYIVGSRLKQTQQTTSRSKAMDTSA